MTQRLTIALVLAIAFLSSLYSEEGDAQAPANSPSAENGVASAPTSVELGMKEECWFTDTVATAFVRFPEVVEQPEDLPDVGDDISLFSLEVSAESADTNSGSVAVIRFIPRRTGLVIFPALNFTSDSGSFRTTATQILVSEPQRSSDMTLELRPEKRSVYQGQPLRVDVTWTCKLTTNRIRSLLCLPEFFNASSIETVVPRCTAEEKEQMGMPFGGRRVIARRVAWADSPEQFGTVTFSLFLRFSEAGTVSLPATRLECAYLKGKGSNFAPYAAYFNNGLFEPMSSLNAYERLYAESEPLTLEVLPLPIQDRSENFSGLFAPCEIEVTLSTNDIEVGQVMEVDLRVHSDAPHGMLELPSLERQRSLRGRFRTSSELSRKWHPDGTSFRARMRPLTTKVTALPSMQIQLFDEELGGYRFLQTAAVPLRVRPRDGLNYFDVRTLQMEATLTNQPTGIWHNKESNRMNDAFNMIIGLLAENFWALLVAGPVLFAILLPWVRDRRKRAVDAAYRRQAEAYRKLQRLPEGTLEKWSAFQNFMATGFSFPPDAWTSGDAEKCLQSLNLPEEDIQQILETHAKSDAANFSSDKPTPKVPNLNSLSRRLFDCLPRATPILVMALILQSAELRASDWSDAESLFEAAIQAPSGLPETESLFSQAALKFEASAEKRHRIGESWYNAGNAWFQSGELGRAISCFRQAEIYRPFDTTIKENLATARALTIDVVEPQSSLNIASMPIRWISAAISVMSLLFWALLLIHIRYRTRVSLTALVVSLVATLALFFSILVVSHHAGRDGVVIVSEIFGRKGPAYSYSTAFHEPLHDGLEFQIVDRRSDWLLAELADGRQCWIPSSETRSIRNSRF
ncbi:hypothetical protein CA13_55760 [Planctomycetes bacterium CA13]|uniref:Tetratricopeptide repeat protein n=1 Tax=Novipirellula herctigrandis TaxID=2527986 RepID=A0A5C5ZA63_9BACT|nr:hypothetical protein CA13_55760 [Planctomycetes bacterium CA13]